MKSENEFVFSGVRFDQKSVRQLDGNRVSLMIPRDSVRKITLRFGYRAERPLIQSIFGLLIVVLGVATLTKIRVMFQIGGVFFVVAGSAIFFLVIGAWAVFTAFRRGHFLLVESDRDKRKLVFSRSERLDSIREFLADVSTALGYRVTDSTLP